VPGGVLVLVLPGGLIPLLAVFSERLPRHRSSLGRPG
jgi:hypothetical protein